MPTQAPAAAPAQVQPKEPIKIGYIGNMSYAPAADALYATKLAIDEINAVGGILGHPLEFLSEDSKGQAPTATAAYKKLVMNDRALVVIAAEGSELNFALQEAGAVLYPEYPHLCMNTCTNHDDLGLKVQNDYEKYKFYFRPFIRSLYYFKVNEENLDVMNHYTGAKRMALLIEDAQWTEFFRKGMPGKYPPYKDVIEASGVDVVYYAETGVTEKMFLPILESLATKNPDYIIFLHTYSDGAMFTKQWAQSAAKDIDLFTTGLATMPTFWDVTGGAALGVVTTAYAAEAPMTEKTLPFIEALKAKYNKLPNWISYGSYEVPYLLKAAAEKSGTVEDVDALIRFLEKVEITGLLGRLAFDETHSYKYGPPYVRAVRAQFQKDGELVVLHPYEVAEHANAKSGKTFIPVRELRNQ